MARALLKVAGLSVAMLLSTGCEATLPESGIVCTLAAPDCPEGFRCCPGSLAGFDGVCTRSVCTDAGADGGAFDAGSDAGPARAVPVELAAGYRHTCLRLQAGHVECWGGNASGQLGQGVETAGPQTVPVTVMRLAPEPLQIEAGSEATCARFADRIQCWGSNRGILISAGPLGVEVERSASPIDVDLNDSPPHQVAVGDYHACAIVGDARNVECWGHNADGQLGLGDRRSQELPATVAGVTGAVDVCAGSQHTCVALEDGTVQCWGAGDRGQLGIGDAGSPSFRTEPTALSLTGVVEIECANFHTCAIVDEAGARTTHCWGENRSGEVQQDTADGEIPVPTPLRDMRGENVDRIAMGGFINLLGTFGFTLVAGEELPLHAFGANGLGQLGAGSAGPRNSSSELNRVVELRPTLVDVAAGASHACAIDEEAGERRVLCWGSGEDGQIGHADSSSVDRPTPVFGYD